MEKTAKRTKDENAEKKTGRLEPKLTRMVLSVVLSAFLLIFLIVLNTAYHYYRKQEIDNQLYQLDKTASQIFTLQTTTANLGKQIIYDEAVSRCLDMEEDSTGEYLYAKRKMQSKLANYSFILDGVREIMLYTTDGRTFSGKYVKQAFVPEEKPWYQNFLESGKKYGFSEVHSSEPNTNGYSVDVVSFIMGYYSVGDTTRELGKLIIDIDLEKIKEFMQIDNSMVTGCTLFDGKGRELYAEGSLRSGYDEIMERNDNGIVQNLKGDVLVVSAGMEDGWTLALEISGPRLLVKALISYSYLLLIFAVLIAILIVALRKSIRKIVNPIHLLSEAALELGSGNFDVNVKIRTNDELEMLADVFNKMVLDIRGLMNKSVEHEKLRRQMQIENLMLQINPHFIYNTMNSIVYMARMSGNPQIADFANAFISLLQSTLDVRDSIYNTVGQEIKTVENYLYLQKYRYEDKFTYTVECEEELKACKILNVMIQPAVENAIFHGIAPKDEQCKLKIVIRKVEEALEVCVEDNGIGMSQETLAELMSPEHVQKGGVRKIGVSNVRERINNIFGAPYNLEIKSELGVGTRVIMTVPYLIQKTGGQKNG